MNEQEQKVHDAIVKLCNGRKVEFFSRAGKIGTTREGLNKIIQAALDRTKIELDFDVALNKFSQEEADEIYEALKTIPEITRTEPDILVAVYPLYTDKKFTFQSIAIKAQIVH